MTNSWNRFKSFVKRFEDLSAIGAANIGATAISAVFWIYLASIIETEAYGEISYLIAIAGIGSIIAYVGGGTTIVVYTAKKIPIEPPIFIISILSSFIVASALFLIFYNISVSLFVIGFVIFGLTTSHFLGKKLFKTYSKYFFLQRLVFVGLALLLYYILGPHGVVLGLALSYFPPIYKVFKIFRTIKVDFSVLRPRIGFMMNTYVKDLTRVFSSETDKLVIGSIFGYALLGNYYLGLQFLSLLSLLPGIVFQYVLSLDASGVSTAKLKKFIILVAVGLAALGIIIAPVILPMLFPKFENVGDIIQIMSFAIVPKTISLMLISKFLGMEKSKLVLIGSGIYLLIQIPLIFILGEMVGVNGIAAALVLGEIGLVSFLLLSNRFVKPQTSSKLSSNDQNQS